MSAQISGDIVKVILKDLHAPIRDPRNVNSSYFLPGQAISDLSIQSVVPVTIPLVKQTNLVVIINIDAKFAGSSGKLTGTVASNPGISLSSDTFIVGQTMPCENFGTCFAQSVSVSISSPSSEVPWGISDDVVWECEMVGQTFNLGDKVTKLVIFAVADDLAPYYKKDGIPLQFLELMVLPTQAAKLTTRDEWITWAVWRCFASRHDDYLKENVFDKYSEAIHSYRYNSFLGGSSNFFFDGGATFDLDNWLLNCNPPAASQWYGVNCYDMSALVQTTLCLGLPYHYRDGTGAKVADPNDGSQFLHTVGKLYLDPFGYINPLDLIGWGMSNSPFFENAKQKSLGVTEAGRQSFGNHAWVYIRNLSTDPQQISALDACAGPSAGIVLVNDYLTTAVDSVATAADTKNFPNYNKNKQPLQLNGVTTIVRDQPLTRWQKNTFMGDSALRLQYNGKTLYPGEDHPGKNLENALKNVGADVKAIPVPLNDLLVAALKAASTAIQPGTSVNETEINLGVTATFQYGPFTVRTADPNITKDGTVIRYDLWSSESGAPTLSITVSVLTDFQQAMVWLITYLSSMNHDVDATWDVATQDIVAGKVLISPKQDPDVPVGAAIQSNVLVTVEGAADKATMDSVLAAVGQFMTGYVGKPLEQFDTSTASIVSTPSALVNDQFQFQIKAPGAVDLSVASETKAVYVFPNGGLDDATQNIWGFNGIVVDLDIYDYDKMKKSIIATFAAQDTYYTTTREFPFDSL